MPPDTKTFEMPVTSMFSMRGHGVVFHGTVLSGRVRVGERIDVTSPGRHVSGRNAGIERMGTHQSVPSAGCGDDIGILMTVDINGVSDGWRRTEEGIAVPVALKLLGSSRPWWRVWA